MAENSHSDLFERVVAYVDQANFNIENVAVLGPHIVSVNDSLGETDVYFDSNYIEAKYPMIWGGSLEKPGSKPFDLGILEGVGQAPRVIGHDAAFVYAQEQLVAKGDADFLYDAPLFLDDSQ